MDRRFLTVLGVSLVFALVVSSVFYQFQGRSSGAEAAGPVDETDVVVATRPLGVGVMIKPADVKLAKVSASSFPKGAFAKVEEVLDRPVVSNILLDEPILDGRLAVKGSGIGLAPTIPVGMRAVTVRVNDVAGVAGFVMPGMRVDVLVTGKPPNQEDAMTNTVLQNLLVLSAGANMQADARGEAIQTPTVTLLATPEESETLTLSNSEGKIQLVLRNSTDQLLATTSGSHTQELYTGKKPVVAPKTWVPAKVAPVERPAPVVVLAPPPPPPPAPPPPPPQVVVFRGNKRTVETVTEALEN